MVTDIGDYRLSETVLDRARGLELPRRQWRVLFAFREPTPENIINDLEIDEDALRLTLVNLANFGLLEKRPAAAPATNGYAPAARQNGHSPTAPPASAPSPVTSTPEVAPKTKRVEPRSADLQPKAPVQPATAGTPIAAPAAAKSKASRGVLLKPVIDFIQNTAGSGTLGQLTVYRVFLKIPPHLLKEAKIQSVKFVDDNFRIESLELQNAIRSAVKRTLNKDVPTDLLPG